VARKLAALLLAGLAGLATVPARADEALVMRLIFEDCLGYVRHGRTPFAGLATRPAPPAVIAELPARMPDRDKAVELLSPRYVASWGADAMARHCMVRTVFEAVQAGAPAKLGVKAEGFVSRVDARAKAAGLTQAETAEHFSPIASNLWSEPRDRARERAAAPGQPVAAGDDAARCGRHRRCRAVRDGRPAPAGALS
jgi:hypothetical protein